MQLIPETPVFCNHTKLALDKLNDHCFFLHFGLFRGFVWTTSLVAHFLTFFKLDAIVGCKQDKGGGARCDLAKIWSLKTFKIHTTTIHKMIMVDGTLLRRTKPNLSVKRLKIKGQDLICQRSGRGFGKSQLRERGLEKEHCGLHNGNAQLQWACSVGPKCRVMGSFA